MSDGSVKYVPNPSCGMFTPLLSLTTELMLSLDITRTPVLAAEVD